MLNTARKLFLLETVPFEASRFPRWQALAAISLIGVLAGLDPNMRVAEPPAPAPSFLLTLVIGFVMVWLAFLAIVGFLRWWLKRGQRWDGQGDLFNLIAASWLVADVLGTGLSALGVPGLVVMPLWFYSVWVGGNALNGAIPNASLGYCITGIIVGMIPAMLASMVGLGLLGALFTIVTGHASS